MTKAPGSTAPESKTANCHDVARSTRDTARDAPPDSARGTGSPTYQGVATNTVETQPPTIHPRQLRPQRRG
jgi:hypothetical protein